MNNDKLRKLAETATPGPWVHRTIPQDPAGFIQGPRREGAAYDIEVYGDDYNGCGDDGQKGRDMAYGAAANPAKFIELLDTIEQQRKLLERARTTLCEIDLAIDLSKHEYAPGLTLLDQCKATTSKITSHLRQQEGENK